MKYILITMMAALLLSANALAAIKIDARQARNMDDVQSLGVIYINHNIATEQEADQALSQQSDAQERSTSSRSSFMNREATAPFTPVPPFTASFPGSLASSRCRGSQRWHCPAVIPAQSRLNAIENYFSRDLSAPA